MDCTSSTSSSWLLVCLAITAMFLDVWSAPTSPHFTTHSKESLQYVANVLIAESGKLRSEICKTPHLCTSSFEHLLRADLKLPEINNVESGCLSTKFNKEKCLPKIYSDLLRFQPYLDVLKESMPSNKNIIEFMQVKTIFLANGVSQLIENPSEDQKDTTSEIALADFLSNDPWTQNLTSYIILQSFKDYMQKTARAVRNSVKVSK
ncbi:interleukin-6 [Engystomops pustulosus]|uniref:interleukin-6 n=1 Tax=Engystomops pustulosus TaxID=76066 RepID=UPI003AFB51F9